MTVEQHIAQKKKDHEKCGYDMADIQDWRNDYNTQQMFNGFSSQSLIMFKIGLERQIEACQKKLDDVESELSRRKAEQYAKNLLGDLANYAR